MVRFISLSALIGCANQLQEAREWTPHADAVAELEASGHGQPRAAAGSYVPLRSPGDRPDVTVYGYWPYWGDDLSTLAWDQLTHVAIFDVGVDSSGNITNTAHWDDHAADAVSYAASWGARIHLVVSCFSDSVMDALLTDPVARASAVSELAAMVNDYGAHGVNVDFEGLDAHLKSDFVDFVAELRAVTDEVYVAMPAVDWSGAYDFDGLADASDGLFLMGYDYHWSGGDPGPVAPLDGGGLWGSYDLQWTVDDYRTWGATDDKLVLGLPLYGREWSTTDTSIPGTSTGSSSSALFVDAVREGLLHGRSYDASAATAYTFPSSTSQLFYDDAQSIESKVDWAVGEGLQGVGFWALTYDDADRDLWGRIDALTHAGGLRLSGPTPAIAGEVNTLTVTGATPGATVRFVFGQTEGPTAVPGCPTELGIAPPRLLPSAVADASGTAVLDLTPPAIADGLTVHFQAMDQGSCAVSNLSTVTFSALPPGPAPIEACYPGVLEDYTACMPVVADSGFGSDYAYPAPIGANYAAPTRYLDLFVEDGSTMIAPNFRLDEIAQDWKGQHAVVQVHAIERLQELRDALGPLVINSGYRSPGYNASVGGASSSRHMYGDGFDIDPVSVTLTELESECYAAGAGYVQVYVSHVHCDWRNDTQEAIFYGAAAPMVIAPLLAPEQLSVQVVAGPGGVLTAPAQGWDCGEPLREWVALGPAGEILGTATGRDFLPPEGTVEVEVTVGRNLTHRRAL
ncbi:MAG TPA: hypothetical protein ENK18_21545 [Deltaproteobacteria bacterium]|nr:hypothetical protein [Deltaproteobacteria bacterium]